MFPFLFYVCLYDLTGHGTGARKPGPWVRIPLRAWMFSVCVCLCVFLCLCTGREALRWANHPSKESYRLSLIKKLRKLSPMFRSGSKLPRVGATRKKKYIWSEVITAMIMKIFLFWDTKSCSPLNINLRFRGTCLLLQASRVSQAKANMIQSQTASRAPASCCFLVWLTL
jgi:hypothetical protein